MIRRVLHFFGTMCIVVAGMTTLHAQTRRIILTDRQNFGRVNYPSTATVTSNMVDGYVKVSGSNRFVFPVSDNSVYRPFAATADGTNGAYFSANPAVATTTSHKGGSYGPLPAGAPFPLTSKDANVGKVSNREYWDINGTTPTKITLSWHLESAMSSFAPGGNLSKIYIIGWNGTKWVKIASTVDVTSLWGNQSTVSAGSMTTTAAIVPNTYIAYTFGADLSATREMAPGADSLLAKDESEIQLNPLLREEVETAVYPNPVRDRLFVRAPGSADIKTITVHDPAGRTMISMQKAQPHGIDVHHLPAGMYVVNIEDSKGKSTSRKIIINK